MAYDLSTLFYSTVSENASFLTAITLSPEEQDALLGARKVLREGLRSRLREAVADVAGRSIAIRPKFVTQGSVSYKTLNHPCRPPQQADLDDGIYLPLSYVQGTGQPSAASDALFAAVAACAQAVASEHMWEVNEDNPSCTRVIVSEKMHIDIPLYAIPDDEFDRLVEARALDSLTKTASTQQEIDELDWDEVASDRVLFATRDRGWLPKDPRPIRDWVVSVIEDKGEQLRRVMRYFKAWRDHQEWTKGDDPKSIMLMVACEKAFDEAVLRRDDLALLSVAKRMGSIVRGSLPAPWDATEDLTARLDKYEGLRADVADRLDALAGGLEYSINVALTATEACSNLQTFFGDRFPLRPDLVYMTTVSSGPAIVTSSPGSVGRQNNA